VGKSRARDSVELRTENRDKENDTFLGKVEKVE